MPKPPCRDLPEFGHSYGLQGAKDPEGVGKRKWIKLNCLKQHSDLLLFLIYSNFRLDSPQS